MPNALVLGGTGILRETVERLAGAGWSVTATSRDPRRVPLRWAELGIAHASADRDDTATLESLLGDGLDLLVDGQCYTPGQAAGLARWSRACGSTVMLSAKAVYVDTHGRHLNSPVPPVWEGRTTEQQPTMSYHGEPHDSREGYGANKAEAERVLVAEGERVSVLRPSKIHGPGARQAREWAIVRRVLDGRLTVPARGGGRNVESTTSATLIAATVLVVASRPGARMLNVADAEPRPARELAQVVAAEAGGELAVVAVPDSAPTSISVLPWTQENVLDATALTRLGVRGMTFPETIGAEVRWLLSQARRGPEGYWQLPAWIDGGSVDYRAEDAWLDRPARHRTEKG